MKLASRLAVLAGAFALALSGAGPVDQLVGTWKMNVAKSQFKPGPAPQSVVTTYSREGDWIVSKSEAVDSSGKRTSRTNRVKADGAEYPYEGQNGKGTMKLQATGDGRLKSVGKRADRTTSSEHTFSADGRVRTQVTAGANAQGQPMNNIIIWERQ
jgi:hypothetical protein